MSGLDTMNDQDVQNLQEQAAKLKAENVRMREALTAINQIWVIGGNGELMAANMRGIAIDALGGK
jgi:hypothetical protein